MNRDQRIPVTATALQKRAIKNNAKKAGLSTSTFLLQRGLYLHITSVLSGIEVQLYRHLINAHQALDNEEISLAKKEIMAAINITKNGDQN